MDDIFLGDFTHLRNQIYKLEAVDGVTPSPGPSDEQIDQKEKKKTTLKELVDLGKTQKRTSLFPGLHYEKINASVLVNNIEEAGNVKRVSLFNPEILEGVNLLPGSPPVSQLYQGSNKKFMLMSEFFSLNSIWSIASHFSLVFFACTSIWLSLSGRPVGLLIFPVLVTIIAYILILVECHNSSALAIIKDMINTAEACSLVNRLRKTKPQVAVEVLPFRFRIEPSEGDIEAVIRNCLAKQDLNDAELFVLRKERKFINFTNLVDASGDLKDYLGSNITKVMLNCTVGFLNTKSYDLYEEEKRKLVTVRGQDDLYALCTESMLVPGMQDCIIVFNDCKLTLNLLISTTAFWIASVLCLTWPYRIWLASKTKFIQFTLVKLLVYDNGSNSPIKPIYLEETEV